MGRVLGQPQLSAGAPALRTRRRRQCRRRGKPRPNDAEAVERFEALASRCLAASPSSPRRSGCRRAGRHRRRSPKSSASPCSTAASTGAGGAPPTATSPPAPTSTGSRREPETAGRRRRARSPARRLSRGEPADPSMAMPSLLADMPVGLKVGTFVHQVLEATDFAAADLRAELTRASRGRARAPPRRNRRSRGVASRAWLQPSRRRSARLAGDLRLRDVRACGSPGRARVRAPARGRRRPDGRVDADGDRRLAAREACRRRSAGRLRREARRSGASAAPSAAT